MIAYERLPKELLDRASLRGNEYAWRIDDIPDVIIASREASLLSIGGQLQFRLPDGGTCECYWIDIDTFKSVPSEQDWQTRVAQAAETALEGFKALRVKYDFTNEGRRAFGKYLPANNLEELMWFVWYVKEKVRS